MKGYDALDCAMISRASAGVRLGQYNELCFLQDKTRRQVEFHADDYKSLRLLAIPSSTSSGDIHNLKLLKHTMYESIKIPKIILKISLFCPCI